MDKIAIGVENLSKRFRIFHEPPLTFQKAAYNLLRGRKNYEEIWALKKVNFAIDEAEAIGLIGPNASGKSTLLRIISGIYMPTSGSLYIKGRVAPFLELGAGFSTEFTGIENLYLYAAVFGLSRGEIRKRIEEIKEFSELNNFLDVPLRQFSFGMRMRLAFSLAVNVNPDILLIDEMLAVGDLAFKEKCFKKIEELKRKGKTLILVSQHMEEIERLCNRVILLDKGEIKAIGSSGDIVRKYKDNMQKK